MCVCVCVCVVVCLNDYMKIILSVLELDKNHILESAPEKFQKMIHLLGINRAIESIAQIILK